MSLSVPTLWIVFVVNFLALGLIWTYVIRSYPNFAAGRYWSAAAFVAAAGAAMAMLRGGDVSVLVPLSIGGGLVIFACCLAMMGVRRFYGLAVSWRLTALITGLSVAGLMFFAFVRDDMTMRILIYSLGQSVPIALTLQLVLSRRERRVTPGARLASLVAILMLAVHVIRAGGSVLNIGGEVSMLYFNPFQAALILLLVFLSMAWNFGFLLMAIDRLRNEVADLALLDDLTGVANRRHLLKRLAEECALSHRTGQPFALLAIDLDGFKAINDRHGHGAGDECLRRFTETAQARLRPGDLLARSGGDEFCVVLPATTPREAAMVARHLVEACREQAASWSGEAIPLAASIGVAQWSRAIDRDPDRLMAQADEALYLAKNQGKNRFAVYAAAPLPEPAMTETAAKPVPLRKTA